MIWLRSLGAVAAGLATVVILSSGADAILHAAGVYPPVGQRMPERLFFLAAAYRFAFTILGGWLTARLAPSRPMAHAWALAGIGFLAGLGGLVAYHRGGAAMGPAWYAYSIPVTGVIGVWIGARLAGRT